MLHASAVFGFYFAGAQAPTQTQPNPWYIAAPAGCASKLAALLHSGCNRADQSTIFALAKVVAKFIEAAATNPTSDLGLGACVADIPAVILSLFATDCPAQGYLFNALVPAGSATSRIPCKPVRKATARIRRGFALGFSETRFDTYVVKQGCAGLPGGGGVASW